MPRRAPLLRLALALLLVPAAGWAAHPSVARAREAVAAGRVDLERDLRPLLLSLQRTTHAETRRELVGAIADLGAADGKSPNAVKAFLREQAPPLLLDVARGGGDPFLQGDALFALRSMGVPRRVLEEAAAIAEADPDAFVQSRGEILRGYLESLPPEADGAVIRPAQSAAAVAAIAQLDELGVTVSMQALRDAARDAHEEIVAALLAAGVPADTGATLLDDTPLYMATMIGCSNQEQETDWLVATVRHLVEAGADLARLDDNGNTALLHAANSCGPRIVELLVEAGAPVAARNRAGLTPLGIALVQQKLDNAEVLVTHGARLNAEERQIVEHVAKDARAKAIVRRASGG